MDQETQSWAEMTSMLVSIITDPSQPLKNQLLARLQLVKMGDRLDVLTGWLTEKNIELNQVGDGLDKLHEFLKNESSESTSNHPPS